MTNRPEGALTLVQLLEMLPQDGTPTPFYIVGRMADSNRSWSNTEYLSWPLTFEKPLRDNGSLFFKSNGAPRHAVDDLNLGHVSHNRNFLFADEKLANAYYERMHRYESLR